jgi:hypothetical protein
MRLLFVLCPVLTAMLFAGCQSAPHPQPLVRSTPVDKSHETAALASADASGNLGQTVSDSSSSTSLSSRWSKLFSGKETSDRMPLPRNDQLLQSGPGGNSARQDIGRDF